MKLLLDLNDRNIGLSIKKSSLRKRRAARAVLFDKGKIALLSNNEGYHKLPGGGIERNETILQALARELKEETGCKADIVCKIGKIVEHRTHIRELQTSYCFIAKVVKKGVPEFDEGEKEAGFKLKWVSLNSAIKIISNEKPKNYEGKFIVIRDLKFLKVSKEILDLRKFVI